ncbi:hypothetical protein SAMN02746009_03270 [Hymenobacter psychrotolerans DSM 18569]|uniref:Uncharacterized protein n=1 Tax=Hymenobacter psychrotolerans DSM 18569 TaxID=1121959 RepID=A0A1M7D1K5_9BACT|nr:hypothetical protein SAMN02746009_03270 [Hymenobacter psychrotolerans DSM 18569]
MPPELLLGDAFAGLLLARQWRRSLHVKIGHELRLCLNSRQLGEIVMDNNMSMV